MYYDQCKTVLDASGKKEDGVGVSDILCDGPCLNSELYKLLLQFQLYLVAITADIGKTYQ